MPSEEELQKARQEQAWQARIRGGVLGLTQEQTNKPAAPHPREILLSDINDQEQRLLNKLSALRQVREEICCLPRDEGDRLLKITRLMQRVTYPQ